MKSLYEIKDDHLSLLELVDSMEDATPEEQEALQEGLRINEENFYSKSENYIKFIRSEEKDIEVIDAEIARLKKLKTSKQNKIDYLRGLLISAMNTFQKTKLAFATIKVSIRKSESVEIGNIDEIPKEYVLEKIEFKADKVKIKEALKSGVAIAGAYLQTTENLSIR